MIISFFTGTIELCIKSKIVETINLISRLDIQYSNLKRTEDGELVFRIPLYHKKKLCSLLNGIGAEYECQSEKGIPKIFGLYKKRWGIAAAALIFAATVIFSTQFIWAIDIKGNKNVPDKEIIDTLRNLGCSLGTRINTINFDTLHNDFLLSCKDIAWISVNMDGTHANVEVKETSRGAVPDKTYYNVVAKEDGQIERVSSFEGKPQVKIGDIVRKGELLLSSVITVRENEVRFESADGEIYAKVNRSFAVEIPINREVKTETGNKTSKKKLKIFDFYINLFLNSGISYDEYDTIRSEKQVVLFNSVELPVWIEDECSLEYSTQTISISKEEARVAALIEYRKKLDEIMGDAELLSIKTRHSFDNDVYKIECELYCLANIAERVPVEIEK